MIEKKKKKKKGKPTNVLERKTKSLKMLPYKGGRTQITGIVTLLIIYPHQIFIVAPTLKMMDQKHHFKNLTGARIP